MSNVDDSCLIIIDKKISNDYSTYFSGRERDQKTTKCVCFVYLKISLKATKIYLAEAELGNR